MFYARINYLRLSTVLYLTAQDFQFNLLLCSANKTREKDNGMLMLWRQSPSCPSGDLDRRMRVIGARHSACETTTR